MVVVVVVESRVVVVSDGAGGGGVGSTGVALAGGDTNVATTAHATAMAHDRPFTGETLCDGSTMTKRVVSHPTNRMSRSSIETPRTGV